MATRTSGELNQLRKEKAEQLIILGRQMHRMIRDGYITDEGVVQIGRRISQIDVELFVGLGNQIPAQGEGICPQCGETLASVMTTFCGKCGANVAEFYSQAMSRCSRCGQLTQSAARYCSVCGVNRNGGV